MKETASHTALIPHLFRQEYAKMTAVLCRHFGLIHIEIAEDIASDTFLKTSEQWAVQGVPDNPLAWLYAVAKNKTKDYFKHLAVFETQVKHHLGQDLIEMPENLDHPGLIADSQLAMIFAVCNPANSTENQICLSLQILCGFSVDKISNAFLTKKETIKKRLHRTRTNLREDSFQLTSLITRGNYYLVQATGGETISKYHLEAGVAYWHTTSK